MLVFEMQDTLAIIYAPGVADDRIQKLVHKLRHHLDRHNYTKVTLVVDPSTPYQPKAKSIRRMSRNEARDHLPSEDVEPL